MDAIIEAETGKVRKKLTILFFLPSVCSYDAMLCYSIDSCSILKVSFFKVSTCPTHGLFQEMILEVNGTSSGLHPDKAEDGKT